MKYLLLFLALAIAASSVRATESSSFCPNGRTQAELNDCAANAAKAAVASLEQFYVVYIKRLSPEQAQLFQVANADWLRYRDSYCKFESSAVQGGSVYPMIFDLCIESQSYKRLQDLRKLSRCTEGDLSCPAFSTSMPD